MIKINGDKSAEKVFCVHWLYERWFSLCCRYTLWPGVVQACIAHLNSAWLSLSTSLLWILSCSSKLQSSSWCWKSAPFSLPPFDPVSNLVNISGILSAQNTYLELVKPLYESLSPEETWLQRPSVWPAQCLHHLHQAGSHRCRGFPCWQVDVYSFFFLFLTFYWQLSAFFFYLAGKSTFFHTHIVPKDHMHVNRVSGSVRCWIS